MDLVIAMVEHHQHVLRQMIAAAATLDADGLERPIELSVEGVDDDLVGVAILTERGEGFDEALADFPVLRERLVGERTRVRGAGPLRQRVRAVRERDLGLFLRRVDRTDKALVARQRRYFENLVQLPLAAFAQPAAWPAEPITAVVRSRARSKSPAPSIRPPSVSRMTANGPPSSSGP